MARAYSLDLRQKAMLHFTEFGNKEETARVFNIHKDTVTNWSVRLSEGILVANKTGPRTIRKLNPKDVCDYLEANRDMTLHELAEVFKVSHVAIWKVLRKSGYVNKKNTTIQRKRRKAPS